MAGLRRWVGCLAGVPLSQYGWSLRTDSPGELGFSVRAVTPFE